jgi:hypothetical protein
MWKANGKTTTLQLFLNSLSPETEKLSLEGTMDLSRDRLILELEEKIHQMYNRYAINVMFSHSQCAYIQQVTQA